MHVGDRVRIQRDENRYPPKGTWPQFRGRTGTVVLANRDRVRPHLTEYGVVFGHTRRRDDGLAGSDIVTWFKRYEMTSLAPQLNADGRSALPAVDGAQQVLL